MNANWETNNLYPAPSSLSGPREPSDNEGGKVYYNQEGFLPIQNAIASAYIKLQANNDLPKISLQVSDL